MDLKKHISSAYKKGSVANVNEEKSDSKPNKISEKLSKETKLPPKKNEKPLVKTVQTENLRQEAKKEVSLGAAEKPNKTEIAKYLIALGKDEAAAVLAYMEPEQVESIVREISTISHLSSQDSKEVLEKFTGLVREGARVQGGPEAAKDILKGAFGLEKARKILEKVIPESSSLPFAFMNDLEADKILQLLRNEALGIKAIVLSRIKPDLAAGVLSKLEKAEQKTLILRLSHLEKIDREVLDKISDGLEKKLNSGEVPEEDVLDGPSNLAALMRHLDPALEQNLLEVLETELPDTAEKIRDQLFTIDSLLLIEDRDMQRFLSTRENRELATVLKGKSENIKKKVLINVSANRAQLIQEEYQQLGPLRKIDVDTATRDFMLLLRKLVQEGTLRLISDKDEYVD